MVPYQNLTDNERMYLASQHGIFIYPEDFKCVIDPNVSVDGPGKNKYGYIGRPGVRKKILEDLRELAKTDKIAAKAMLYLVIRRLKDGVDLLRD